MRDEACQIYSELDMVHWHPSGRRRIAQSILERLLQRPSCIADIGCGTGTNLEMLAKFAPVVGVDFSLQAIACCRARHFFTTAVASLAHLPFRDNSFDLVCAMEIIEHLDNDAAALCELLRICRPGGMVLVTVPAYQWLWSQHDDANLHRRRYSRTRLRRLFAGQPADILKLSHFNFFLSPLIIAARLLGNLMDKLHPPQAPKLDMARMPQFLNSFLLVVFAAERFLISHINLPAGISILCVARKRGNDKP